MIPLSLGQLIRAFPGRFAIAALLSLCVGALGWTGAFFVQIVLDHTHDPNILVAVALGAAFLTTVRFALFITRKVLLLRLAGDTETRLSQAYLAHVVHMRMSEADRFAPGDLIRRLRSVDYLRQLIEDRAVALVFDAVLVILAITLLAWRGPGIALLIAAGAALPAAITYLIRRRTQDTFREMQETDARFTQRTIEAVRGLRDLRLLGGEPWMLERLGREQRTLVDAKRRYAMGFTLAQALNISLTTLTGLLILLLGATRVRQGGMTPGELMFIFTLAGMLFGPLEQLASSGVLFGETRIAMGRLADVLKLSAEPKHPTADIPFPAPIRFEGVHFGYQPERPILRDINLDIAPGECIAVVGESGAGKSTLLHLLAGLHTPQQGRILIGTRHLSELSLEAWRKKIGAVFHEPRFFEASIRDNLRLGKPTATFEEIRRATQLAHAEEFILEQSAGYDTVLAHTGGGFSAGQLQRLALARALVGAPPLLLLDEATNNLDARTEAAILAALAEREGTRTTVFVTHRLSSSIRADRIIVLHEGRIAEQGSYRELMDRSSLYAQLWRRQIPQHI